MHGLILLQLQKYVSRIGGPFAWQMIHDDAGLPLHSYSQAGVYSDDCTKGLVRAAARAFSQSDDEFQENFGAYLFPQLLSIYQHAIDPNWDSLDLLQHTASVIHAAVRAQLPGVSPPSLDVERFNSNEAIVRYRSSRMMCPLFVGILKGMSVALGESLQVSETACCRRGSPCCVFSLKAKASVRPAQSEPVRSPPSIARATVESLSSLCGLFANEGWLPTVGQPHLYHSVDPSAGSVLLANDQIRGGITGFAISPEFGSIGNLVVSPEYRGAGNGKRLFERCLDELSSRLAANALLSLDSPPELIQFFMRYSFFPCVQFLRVKMNAPLDMNVRYDVQDAHELPQTEVVAFDTLARGYSREKYINSILNNEATDCIALVNGSEIVGLCTMAPTRRGYRIRDLISRSSQDASSLLNECIRRCRPDPVFMDLYSGNRWAKETMSAFGMVEIAKVSRLYQRRTPDLQHDWIYGMSVFG